MKTLRRQLGAELKDKKFAQEFRKEAELRDMALHIAEQRAKLSITQAQLAKRAHITQQQLSRVENGTNCTMATFLKVCDALGLQIGLRMSGRRFNALSR